MGEATRITVRKEIDGWWHVTIPGRYFPVACPTYDRALLECRFALEPSPEYRRARVRDWFRRLCGG